jgi:hypothetical protein
MSHPGFTGNGEEKISPFDVTAGSQGAEEKAGMNEGSSE